MLWKIWSNKPMINIVIQVHHLVQKILGLMLRSQILMMESSTLQLTGEVSRITIRNGTNGSDMKVEPKKLNKCIKKLNMSLVELSKMLLLHRSILLKGLQNFLMDSLNGLSQVPNVTQRHLPPAFKELATVDAVDHSIHSKKLSEDTVLNLQDVE